MHFMSGGELIIAHIQAGKETDVGDGETRQGLARGGGGGGGHPQLLRCKNVSNPTQLQLHIGSSLSMFTGMLKL